MEQTINTNDKLESEALFSECLELAKNGKLTKPDIDVLVKLLSSDYKVMLEKMSTLEQCIESACEWRDLVDRKERLYRIATLPGILARNLILTLKNEKWATIIYDEEAGTKNESISDAARLVDIFVEPNTMWDGYITFKIVSRGYISKQDFDNLMSATNIMLQYYTR